MRIYMQGLCWVVVCLATCWSFAASSNKTRPNVVLIMTDNHGAWTLGCYGNPDIRTPNIDRLATEGTLFTRAFASNPVCSPTRATFLTGLMPSQHGVHCFLRGGRLQVGPEARCTLDEITSLPEVLRDSGYSCGLVGKWHLGGNMQPQEGFDDYWITMPHGGTSTFYDAQIIEDGRIRTEPKYLTEFWTDHAVNFIEKKKDGDQPFFLFLAYNGPYSLGRLLLREGKNRHAAYYADKELPSFPREPTHPWQFSNRDYINNPVSIRRMATEVSGVDDGVGRVMEALKKHKLDKDTVVIFTADQGAVGGHGGFWGMGDHTRPLTAYDGMMHIPMIWRHPDNIAAGKRSDAMVSNYDFMPTLLSYLGMEEKMPSEPKSPGGDFSKEFVGRTAKASNRPVFYEFENTRSIRTEAWKYVRRFPNGPDELYDLKHDPSEQSNLAANQSKRNILKSLKKHLGDFFQKYAEPKYNLWESGSSQTVLFSGIDKKLAAAKPVEPPPLEEGFVIPKIKVPEGYTVELVAGPPLVQHPLMANFDDRGRLFIADNAGLNLRTKDLEEQLPNYIRMIEDTDGDGRFDRSTIFADKLTFPQGCLWHDGALYVASPPNIWRLEDTDDDGVADKREVIVNQFGYTGNAASVHGCFLGPDGRIYWCDGRHGHEFRDKDGNITSKKQGSYIFSCNPDGTDVRPHCGGGMDNPVEVDFTDEGDVLGTVNILYSRPRNDCLVHWLYGGTYPHSERVLGEFQRTGDLLGPVHKFGHVAVSGMTRYRSGVLDRSFRDDMFVTIFNTGKVLRVELEREGSTYRAQQHEFLTIDSRDSHPTDVLEDADGSLLVIDTGGWFRIGCPTSQIAKPDVKGAIYRVRRKGMTPLVDPWGKQIDWNKLPDNQLAALLNDTRYKVRERAIHECGKCGDRIVPVLQSIVRRRDSRQRRNAVWALARIGSEKANAALRLALDDNSASVRQAACRAIATTHDPLATSRLIDMLVNDRPAVRRVAASALGRIGDPKAIAPLLEALEKSGDRAEEHALIFALIEIDNHAKTANGLAAESTKIQRGALIALDQMDSGKLTPNRVTPLLNSDDESLRVAAVDIIRRREDWKEDAVKTLANWLGNESVIQQHKETLQALAAEFVAEPKIASLVGKKLGSSTPELQTLLLAAISQNQSLELHKSWTAPITKMLVTRRSSELEQVIAAIRAIKTDEFDSHLNKISADTTQPLLVRVSAIEAVSGDSRRLNASSFRLLTELLGQGASPRESARAAQMIGGASLTKEQQLDVAKLLKSAGPLELRELVKPFQRNATPEVATAFLAAIKGSRGFMSLQPHEFSDVVKRFPPELLDQANPLLDQLQQREAKKQERLEELLTSVHQGNATRGRTVFTGKKSKCSTCHRIGTEGGRIGPDLSRIGRIRNERDLLEAIVFPSSSLVREYEPFNVVTNSGKVMAGLIVDEKADSITLQTAIGDPVVISRDTIEEIVPSTVSIMPNGLDQALTKQELSDVVSYLRSLK